jgi:hypothetical protein
VPQAAPLQPLPVRLHETEVLLVFNTVAVNCLCFPAVTCAEVGEMLTATGRATVTTADPDLAGSATDVATTETWAGLGGLLGAVYTPLPVMVPHAELPQAAPARCQVTFVIVVPDTKATKSCCWPTKTLAWEGETFTVMSEEDPTITAALADAERSARDVAVTVTTFELGATAGAR